MSEEPSDGKGVTVVEPGSSDDPFRPGAEPPDPAPTEKPESSASQPTDKKSDDAGGEPAEGFTPQEDQALLAELNEAIEKRVGQVQSTKDKEIAKIADSLKETQKELGAVKRNARLEGLTDEQKAELENRWRIEDRERELDERSKAVDDYRAATTAYDLMVRYGQYGLTKEALEAAESPEDMEIVALKVKSDFLEGGKPPEKKADKAKSDVGGSAPPPEEPKLGTEQGVDKMAENVKGLFSQPGNVR